MAFENHTFNGAVYSIPRAIGDLQWSGTYKVDGLLCALADHALTYTANQYGVVLSGSGNQLSVLAPDSSTTKVLVSGGLSANPSWGIAYSSTNVVSTLMSRDANGVTEIGEIDMKYVGASFPIIEFFDSAGNERADISYNDSSPEDLQISTYGNLFLDATDTVHLETGTGVIIAPQIDPNIVAALGALDIRQDSVTQDFAGDIFLTRYTATNTDARHAIQVLQVANGSYGALTAMGSGALLGEIDFKGYGTTDFKGGTAITAKTTQIFTDTHAGSQLLFYTTPNNSVTGALALTLDQDQSATFANTVTATTFVGAFSGTVTNATNVATTNDTTTNATFYPTFVSASSGNNPITVSSTKMTFNPSTGALISAKFGDSSSLFFINSDTATNSNLAVVFSDSAVTNGHLKGNGNFVYNPNTDSLYVGHVSVDANGGPGNAVVFPLEVQSAASAFGLSNYGSTATANPQQFFRYARGNIATPTASQSGDTLGQINFQGYGTSFATGAKIDTQTTELWTATAHGTKLRFLTTANGSASGGTLALTLDQDQSATFANTVNATTFVGAFSGTATTATNTTITDDTTTNATMYPTWVTVSSGDRPQKVSSTKLTFNPSTGTLTATAFSGNHTGSIAGTTVSGTTGTTNLVFSASPTLTGTLTAADGNFSGTLTATTQMVVGASAAETTTSNAQLQVLGTSGTMKISRFTAGTGSPQIRLYKSRGASIGTLTAVNSGDGVGNIVFGGVGSDAAGYSNAADILVTADATPGSGIVQGKFVIRTATSAGTLTQGLVIDSAQNVCIGPNSAVATSATDGFFYIPTCAGTPSGTPTSKTGCVPMIYDTTNNKFYIYNGAWKGGTNPGTFS